MNYNDQLQEAVSVYSKCMENLVNDVNRFSDESFNEVPFENSWTGGQVAEHILKSQANFTDLLGGEVEVTDRPADEKRSYIEKIFLDFTTKMKSPEYIKPTDEPKNKEQIIAQIQAKKDEITAALQQHDLTKICLAFELPGSGKFTGFEWAWFITYHTQRHVHQIENILATQSVE